MERSLEITYGSISSSKQTSHTPLRAHEEDEPHVNFALSPATLQHLSDPELPRYPRRLTLEEKQALYAERPDLRLNAGAPSPIPKYYWIIFFILWVATIALVAIFVLYFIPNTTSSYDINTRNTH